MLVNPRVGLMPVSAFEAAINDLCSGFEVRAAVGRDHTRGTVTREEVAGFDSVHIACGVDRVVRPPEGVRSDDSRNFFLIVQEEGRALMQQAGEARILRRGDVMLIDSAYASEFSYFGSYQRQFVAHVARDEMLERVHPDVRGGMFFPGSDHLTGAMRGLFAKGLHLRPEGSRAVGLRDAVLGVLSAGVRERVAGDEFGEEGHGGRDEGWSGAHGHGAGTLGGSGQGAGHGLFVPVGTDTQEIAAVRAFVDAHLTQPETGPQEMAAAAGISVRQLQRAFRAHLGTTPSRYLIERRLELAARLLTADGASRSPISSVAFAVGFSDVSYFNRSFRAAFGVSPSGYRG